MKKFNLKTIEERMLKGCSPTILIVGRRESGKTTIAKDILNEFNDMSSKTIVITSDHNKEIWENYVDEKNIFNKFDSEILKEIIEKQRKIIKRGEINLREYSELGVCLIIDEISYDNFFKNKYIRDILFNGRFYNITLIITYQHLTSIFPDILSNIDYFIFCYDNNIENLKRFYMYFFGIIEKFDDFKKIFKDSTENNGYLIIDSTIISNKIEDCNFWYKLSWT